ncbi:MULTISPECIES: NAD-dependent DNA ligase LigA [Streptomyces]|uniref:NAD-dependent DNA ligase LigA n=1 Tax=Streptomyces TaxID=1883 RepID=UPI00116515B3|nr:MULTISPECIES: NAD-dependent DNA ligase LigA [Streptomyces]MCX4615829.1 NAD-dependent DNA ligase LigA [Streptomyces mirabilis]MCX5347396.1 NAD-dependent DNA ligase LigA [Streptomyces mirabilis]NMI56529.1 NAD-dependent DNA ligase LigA [Streptomyces sp. RLA2-12]QDN55940.1 NAD-dependent DNA ligase LigA [Streptomyces sp. S1D4-20]QDN66117.1 NAD-dependent DNA ligase LigA [Streptomyces sp. S1D4-14]
MAGMTTPAAVIVDAAAYAQAVEDAVKASAAYYAGGTSVLDDDTYDRLVRGIAAWESAHPDEVLPDSPTGKVAGGAVEGDVPHTVPMLSLDNVFSPEEFTAWTASLARRIGHDVTRFGVEPKLDGLAIAARYTRGRLTRLITRGDGTAGEDVSHAIGTVEGLPAELTEPVTVEVRGEVLMTTAQFEHANEVRTAHGGQPFANPRNAAAGTLRAKDRAYTVPMTFFGYALLPLPGTEGALAARLAEAAHSELMARCGELGVNTTAVTAVPGTTAETAEQVLARVKEIAALRAELPFGIDGIVVKADLAADQEAAGSGSRAPRWAIAYKLPAVEKITRLLEVEWNVGRTGIIAPRAVLEPVEIDGSTITYATLHNPADITRRDLRLGDHVMVHRAGDVIPRVEAPVAHLRTGEERPIVFPEVCPRCGSTIDTSEQRWRCENGRNCHLVAALSYAAGRDQLDIEGLGHTRVVQLVEAGLVADLADVFALTRDQLLALERMGETSTDNLLAAIGAAKGQPLSRVLCALGVRGTGRSMSRRIARYFATMDHIRAADAEAMQRVEGIGTEKAPSIVAELAELAPLIDKLAAAGVNMTEPGATPPVTADDTDTDTDTGAQGAEPAGGPLTGMAVVVTGAMTGPLEKLSRNQMNELIERAGGRSSSSVSKKTTLVVAGEGAGSKRAKAEDLGIRLVTPDEFATLVADYVD